MKIRIAFDKPLISESKEKDWWGKKTEQEQEEYIQSHKKTKKKKTHHELEKDKKDDKKGKSEDDSDLPDDESNPDNENDENEDDDSVDSEDSDSEGSDESVEEGERIPKSRFRGDPESHALHTRAMDEITHDKRHLKKLSEHPGPAVNVNVPDAHKMTHQEFVDKVGLSEDIIGDNNVDSDKALVKVDDNLPEESDRIYPTIEQQAQIKQEIAGTKADKVYPSILKFYKDETVDSMVKAKHIAQYVTPVPVQKALVAAKDATNEFVIPKIKEATAPIVDPIAEGVSKGIAALSTPVLSLVQKYSSHPVADKAKSVFSYVNGKVVGEDPDYKKFLEDKENHQLMTTIGLGLLMVGCSMIPGLASVQMLYPVATDLMEHYFQNMKSKKEKEEKEDDDFSEYEKWKRDHPSLTKDGKRQDVVKRPSDDDTMDDHVVASYEQGTVPKEVSKSSDDNFEIDSLSPSDRYLLLSIIDNYKKWMLSQDFETLFQELEERNASSVPSRKEQESESDSESEDGKTEKSKKEKAVSEE